MFGTFRVLHQVGSGVLGPVFRAYDSELDQLVAVKAFRLDLVPQQVPAFAEALNAIVARPVNDPAVVRPVAAGLAGELPFLAEQYLSGDALDVVLRRAGALNPDRAVATLRALARAIDEAWDVGVGHGSLHPRDVFLIGTDETCVTGFGIAQALDQVGIKAPVRRPYTSPERAAGAAWDRRADVYSLAAMVHELLTAAGMEVGASVAAAVDRAMSEAPGNRFETAKAFVDAVESGLVHAAHASEAGRPTSQHPVVLVDEVAAQDPVSSAPLHFALEVAEDGSAPATALWTTEVVHVDTATEPVVAPPAFPWLATVTVGVAGAALGVLIGFQIGFTRGSKVDSNRVVASPPVAVPVPQTPVTTPTPAEPRVVAEVPKPAPPASRIPTAAVLAGALQVDSRPRGARVSVDGRRVGATPLRVAALSPGDHRVLIELNGHRRVASTVKVSPGEQTRLAVSLEPTDFGRWMQRNR